RGAALTEEERRLLSLGRDRVVPSACGPRAGRPRRGRLLREADAEVRADPDDGAPRLPPDLAELPEGDEELARRQAMGEGTDLLAAWRALAADPLYRAPPVARGRGLPDRSDAKRRDPDSRRSRRVDDAFSGPRRNHRGRDLPNRALKGAAIPAFAGDALLDLHRLPRVPGQRGRVQGHGPFLLRKAELRSAGEKDRPAGGRPRALARHL